MDLENLTLEQTRKAIKEEWRCNLGDGMKAMLLGLVDRLELAESKLAAMESQEPYVTLHAEGEGCRIEWHHPWTLMAGSQSFYIKPVPADKPAVAVPHSIISNIEFALNEIYNETAMQVCCGRPGQECCGSPDVDWPSWATEAITKLSSAIDSLLSAAPSHSQQSVDKQHEWDHWIPTAENINALPARVRSYIYELETIADPSGLVHQNVFQRDQIAGLQAAYNGLKAVIDNAYQCFQAAYVEGWLDDLSDGNIDNIRDIWQRRIVYAMQELERVPYDRCPSHESEQS